MPVQEAIRRLEKEVTIKKSRRQQIEEAALKIYDNLESAREKRYKAGYEKARETQNALLEELRGVGVVDLIEEMTGPIRPIENIGDDDGSEEHWKKRQKILTDSMDDVHREFSGNWTASIKAPEKQLDGSPTNDLVLEIRRVWVEHPVPNMSPNFVKPTLTVTVEYGTDKHMKIKGNTTTFTGRVYPNKLPQHEEALAKAFLKPRQTY